MRIRYRLRSNTHQTFLAVVDVVLCVVHVHVTQLINVYTLHNATTTPPTYTHNRPRRSTTQNLRHSDRPKLYGRKHTAKCKHNTEESSCERARLLSVLLSLRLLHELATCCNVRSVFCVLCVQSENTQHSCKVLERFPARARDFGLRLCAFVCLSASAACASRACSSLIQCVFSFQFVSSPCCRRRRRRGRRVVGAVRRRVIRLRCVWSPSLTTSAASRWCECVCVSVNFRQKTARVSSKVLMFY